MQSSLLGWKSEQFGWDTVRFSIFGGHSSRLGWNSVLLSDGTLQFAVNNGAIVFFDNTKQTSLLGCLFQARLIFRCTQWTVWLGCSPFFLFWCKQFSVFSWDGKFNLYIMSHSKAGCKGSIFCCSMWSNAVFSVDMRPLRRRHCLFCIEVVGLGTWSVCKRRQVFFVSHSFVLKTLLLFDLCFFDV